MYNHFVKRILDLILSFAGIIILFPIFIFISILIYFDDPGVIFFSQKRVGINKHIFNLYKFRTMKMSTPHVTPTHLLKNPDKYITKYEY